MKPYSRIVWGLAFELIDFRIQFFDIMPDVVGYILIMLGLSGIQPRDNHFRLAWVAAGLQMILSIPRIVGQPFTLSLVHPEAQGVLPLLMTAIETLAEMAMLYGICAGIRDRARRDGRPDLAHAARTGWFAIFSLGAVSLFVIPFSLNVPSAELTLFLGVLAFAFFVSCLWVIVLVRRAGKSAGGGGGDGGEPAEAAQSIVT